MSEVLSVPISIFAGCLPNPTEYDAFQLMTLISVVMIIAVVGLVSLRKLMSKNSSVKEVTNRFVYYPAIVSGVLLLSSVTGFANGSDEYVTCSGGVWQGIESQLIVISIISFALLVLFAVFVLINMTYNFFKIITNNFKKNNYDANG